MLSDTTKNFIRSALTVLCIGMIGGFAYGCFTGIREIADQRYIQYTLFKIAFSRLLIDVNISFIISILCAMIIWITLCAGKFVYISVLNRKLNQKKPIHQIYGRLIRSAGFIIFLVMLISNIFSAVYFHRDRSEEINVVVLLVDSLRADHMSLYGYHRDTTPNITAFAKQATVYKNAISQAPWTIPSVSSLFSCLYPAVHGIYDAYFKDGKRISKVLDKKLATVAEILNNKGYATGAFVANRLITEKKFYDQGFDYFSSINDKTKPLAEEVNVQALAWLETNKHKPFFMYVHYQDVHSPYSSPEPFDSMYHTQAKRILNAKEKRRCRFFYKKGHNDLNYYIDRYDGAINYIDCHINQFIDRLNKLGLMDNTMVIITADHGESFLEHGFASHGFTVYNPEIRVPLIVKFPKQIPYTKFTNDIIQLIDVTATIIEVTGCAFPYKINGISLLADYSGERTCFSQELSSHVYGPPKISMITGNYKAIYAPLKKRIIKLYNYINDPEEKNNLISRKKHMVKELQQVIISRTETMRAEGKRMGLSQKPIKFKMTERQKQSLKALGYIAH